MIEIGLIITLSNAKTGAFGGSVTYHGLPEAQAQLQIYV